MATIIRRPERSVIPRTIVEAHVQATEVRQEARDEAKRILREAENQRDQVLRQAELEGLERAREQVAQALVQAQAIRDQAFRTARTEITAVCIAAAREVVGQAISETPTHVAHVVDQSIRRARRAEHILLRAHPDDLQVVQASLARFPHLTVRVVPDPLLTRGGCLLTSELGDIDARVEVQLDAVGRVLGQSLNCPSST